MKPYLLEPDDVPVLLLDVEHIKSHLEMRPLLLLRTHLLYRLRIHIILGVVFLLVCNPEFDFPRKFLLVLALGFLACNKELPEPPRKGPFNGHHDASLRLMRVQLPALPVQRAHFSNYHFELPHDSRGLSHYRGYSPLLVTRRHLLQLIIVVLESFDEEHAFGGQRHKVGNELSIVVVFHLITEGRLLLQHEYLLLVQLHKMTPD